MHLPSLFIDSGRLNSHFQAQCERSIRQLLSQSCFSPECGKKLALWSYFLTYLVLAFFLDKGVGAKFSLYLYKDNKAFLIQQLSDLVMESPTSEQQIAGQNLVLGPKDGPPLMIFSIIGCLGGSNCSSLLHHIQRTNATLRCVTAEEILTLELVWFSVKIKKTSLRSCLEI